MYRRPSSRNLRINRGVGRLGQQLGDRQLEWRRHFQADRAPIVSFPQGAAVHDLGEAANLKRTPARELPPIFLTAPFATLALRCANEIAAVLGVPGLRIGFKYGDQGGAQAQVVA